MNRTKPIAALEKAQKYAASLNNPSVEAFKAQGGKVIGTFDPEVPFEIFEAAGLMPFALRGTGATSTEYADKYFKQLTCDFTRSMFNELVRGQYDFLDGAVVYNCCDHMRRIDDNWKLLPNAKNFHFLYIPKRWDASTYPRFCEEIQALIKSVEETYDVKITADALRAAIVESNKTRALIRQLYELRKDDEVLIDGTEVMNVLTAGESMPRAEYNAMLTELIAELKAGGESVKPRRRLMLLSGHANTAELLSALESQGALIVVDDASNGLRMAEKDISEEGDPFAALCDFYFNVKTPMPRAFGTQDRRFETYLRLFDEYRADSAHELRIFWQLRHRTTENGFERLNERDIASASTRKHHLRFKTDLHHHAVDAASNGIVNSGTDVFERYVVVDQRNHLALGENGTLLGNLTGMCRLQCRVGQFLKRAVKHSSHDFKKAAGACRAFVIHLKILHATGFAQ